MTPLVSILISCYNHAHFVAETLDSVKADTYPNKEIVIIDDGSKDNSVQVIENWMKENPGENVTFSHRPNKGFCASLNELLDIAAGKYIVLVASDDLLVNNTIAERVEILQNSDKMVLVSDAEVINDNGATTHKSMLSDFHNADKVKYKTEEGILDEILFNFAISGAVVMMDKNIFSVIGKYPEDLKGEDFYFYIKSASEYQIVYFDKIVSKYRIHSSNTSGVNSELYVDNLKIYKRLFLKVPGFIRKTKIIKRLIGMIAYSSLARIKT